MRRALLHRFSMILFVALAVSSAISYFVMGNKVIEDKKRNLEDMVHMVDYALDYNGDIQKECIEVLGLLNQSDIRITIVRPDGDVLADTEVESYAQMKNHLEREEIQAALSGEIGYAERYSSTLQKNMLYVAKKSAYSDCVVRIAFPYSGLEDYFYAIFPVLLTGAVIAYLIGMLVSAKVTNTVIRPVNEVFLANTKLSEEVKEKIARLEFEKKVRQEFFSNASHELKTPITAIRGYAELLDNGFVTDEETKQKFVKKILKSTESMTRLIEDILMISRLETKDAEVTISMVNLSVLADEIFEAVDAIASEYQITLHKDVAPVIIEASVKQMRELLMNLIVNGIKYNHPEGNVWLKIESVEHNVVIRVKDDGMGMGEEHQKRIFERFYRIDKSRSKKMGGTGLGLSIVKHIVEYNNGYMRLKSKLNVGSEFIISIPLQRKMKEQFMEKELS